MDTGEDAEKDAFFFGLQNAFNAAEAKYLGTQLTGAEREANAFTAEQSQLAWERSQKSADIAWQRELEASNTQYQRKVADLQAAGLNPMLAVSSGGSAIPSASVASSSSGSSVSPSGANLGDLLSFFSRLPMLKAQVKNVEADTEVKEAEASNLKEQERGSKIINDWNEVIKPLEAEAKRISNSLNGEQIALIKATERKTWQEIENLVREADTEVSRKLALDTQALLDKASYQQIVEMLPYQKALATAQTENDKASAMLHFIEFAYQNKLLSDGYVDAFISTAKSSATSAESKATLDSLKADIRTGDYGKSGNKYVDVLTYLPRAGIGYLATMLDSFNPLGKLFD